MLEALLNLDKKLFLLLNAQAHCGLLDALMPFATDLDHWKIPILLIVLGLLIGDGRRGRWTVALLLLAVAATDQLSSHVLKDLVARARPCHVLDGTRLLIGCSGSFSFPSSHAANIAASMFVLSYVYRPWWPLFGFFAFLIGYSRIYVGVHYPLDVLGGWVLGLLMAGAFSFAWKKVNEKWALA